MRAKIFFAFLLHNYQPPVWYPGREKLIFPWVRQHAARDYADLVLTLRRYPEMKAAFELSPSLIKQVQLYRDGRRDEAFGLSQKRASDLSLDHKIAILDNFFDVDREMMRPVPRYRQLMDRRGDNFEGKPIGEKRAIAGSFSDQELMDLQVLYNLVWIGPESRRAPNIRALFNKGKEFSAADRDLVLATQIEILNRLTELYREASNDGILEIPTGPMYHPILPLLNDSHEGGRNVPQYSFPADVVEQARLGVEQHWQVFGAWPTGMWPSEGGVALPIFPLIAEAAPSIRWLATDATVLARTIANLIEPRPTPRAALFDLERSPGKPDLEREWWKKFYPWLIGSTNIALFFRDKGISDSFAFGEEQQPEKAAARILASLEQMAHDLPNNVDIPPLVTLAGDGENMQGSRPKLGLGFFETLYDGLGQLKKKGLVEATTPTAYLNSFPPTLRLSSLQPGTWLYDFSTWIGHPKANRMWRLLAEARRSLTEDFKTDGAAKQNSYQAILRAQSSCFFWWLNNMQGYSKGREKMDDLQRALISQSYIVRGLAVPDNLQESSYN